MRNRHFIVVLTLLAIIVAPVTAVFPAGTPRAAAQVATTNSLRLRVVSARTEPDHPGGAVTQGDPVTSYQFMINVDNTGDPTQPRDAGCSPENAGYPDSCNWPSIRAVPGAAPIFTQGDNTVLNETTGFDLPPGKYLITVLADGYKIDGAHFTVPLEAPGIVEVGVQPHPLPPATMRIKVFEDITSTNGQFDAPGENGLAGFRVSINDILGEVTVDVFGSPLCTEYDANGDPLPGNTGACLISDANGDIAVPNLGPNRYDVLVIPPDGQVWLETTTLEGSWSWDTWLQEGGTGLDNEFVVAGEPFPWTIFGFVRPMNLLTNTSVTGGVSGTIVEAAVYIPQSGGLPYYGGEWNGLNGAKVTGPIEEGWVALSDLQNGDTAVYIGPTNPDGTFNIPHVPDGNYLFTYWDRKLHHILDWLQVTVSNGQVTDLGSPFLTGWFTRIEGTVFNDLNSNGKQDPGEPGVADYLVVLKDRDNTEIDRMSIAATTDQNGHYVFEKAYPMGSWMILEAYADRYYTTGVTYQAENQPTETTVLGAGVDVGMLPNLGFTGRLDWGVRTYDRGTNGGIVGTVSYDTTRNELDPRFAAVEGWQPGIPGLTVNLYGAVKDPDTGDFIFDPTGAYSKTALLNTTPTEFWEQPVNCQERDANGNPLDQYALPPATGDYRCLEAPMMGLQFQTGFATLDGNYGFGDGCFGPGGFNVNTGACADGSEPTPLPAGDYLVEIVSTQDAFGNDIYKVTKEEDINIFDGDEFVPQVPPPACAGALHTVDVAGVLPDGLNAVYNPLFAEGGGSPFEGMDRPLCDVKLVTLANGRSIAPTFNFFTEVPIPGKWKGYIIDDLTLATNQQQLFLGEKAGIPNMPIGIYDFTNRLLTTIQSDPNGVYEVLLPSSNTINCPTPSGVCPNVYYILGNDPGQPDRLNPNYNPQYRTIGASFEIWPGVMLPSDLAPTQIGVSITAPGSQFTAPPACTLEATTPQIFAVSRPYVTNASRAFTIQGQGFGATQGTGRVTLNDTINLSVSSWTDTQINVSVPTSVSTNPYQLKVRANNGQTTVNGLTFHVRGTGYNPSLFEVGPGRLYTTIQAALDAAAATTQQDLVVVYPDTPTLFNPHGVYYENLVIYEPVKLQGVGPGGVRANGSIVLGSAIDGVGMTGDTAYSANWRTFVQGLTWSGNQTIYEGPVIYLLVEDGEFTTGNLNLTSIDGFTIQGGDQQGFPNFLPGAEPGAQNIVTVQGGGIFANAYARYLQITNNILKSNGGAYAGAIRLGTPHLPGAANDNQNDGVRIAYNRILANGGTNLAGAIGLFSGSDGYEIANNDICGNFSAEYGGGISAYGYSPNGSIHHNRIYFNRSYDEGGGIMIAGELPADPALLSPGSGPVTINANLIQANLANDDGGGIRFLMAGNFPMTVTNNMIVNNISTHEGGGVSLNDAPAVRVYNNTIMKNLTTATAVTSNGQPAPTGLSSSRNSVQLQATLPGGSPLFSNPLLFNNIFWDNRAGTWTGGGVAGIGLAGDPTPINYWDLGVSDGTGSLSPTNSLLQVGTGTVASPSNVVGANPQVIATYETSVNVLPWRGNPRFVDPIIVAVDAPVTLLGDYHLSGTGSPAYNTGAASKAVPSYQQPPTTLAAPMTDFDNQSRPAFGSFDTGADEFAGAQANLSITKTDGQASVNAGAPVNYTIVVSNNGPNGVAGATVTDNFPAVLTVGSWTCTATLGSSCTTGGSGNNRTGTVTLTFGGSATFIANTTLSASATGSLANTASVATPAGTTDPSLANNSATDTDAISLPLPTLGVLDNFNRANATTLNNGSNWSQATIGGTAAIRINANQASCPCVLVVGRAMWNNPTSGFGVTQGAAFTFAQDAGSPAAPVDGSSLILKGSGGTANIPQNFIRVQYQVASGGQVVVATTTNLGVSYTTRGTFPAAFANGDTLTARANANGSVDVWRTTAANVTTYLGRSSSAPAPFTGAGRIGMQFPSANSRVDNFRGGTTLP